MDPLLTKNLITTKDAGELSGYTSDYLARLARSGKIVGRRIGHSWLIERESLAEFLNQQGDRKIDYTRALARAREAEYRAHRSFIGRATKTLTTPLPVPQFVDLAKSSLRSQAFALSAALLVVVSGAFVAKAAVIPQLAEKTGAFAHSVASGFDATFGDVSSHIAEKIDAVNNDLRARPASVATASALASAEIATPLPAALDLSMMPTPRIENQPAHVATALVAASTSAQVLTVENLQSSARALYENISSPSLLMRTLAHAYVATGRGAYHAITASLAAYRSLTEQSGTKALALAATTRDFLGTTPALVGQMNLAIGTSIVAATHAVIHADVSLAYGTAKAAPESARATVAFLGSTGNALAGAASRVPALAQAIYLRATEAPAHLAPQLASSVFNTEYAAATHLVPVALGVSEHYLALVKDTGYVAYAGTTGAKEIAQNAGPILASTPAAVQDAYLGALGKGALAIDTVARIPKVASVLSVIKNTSAPLVAAVLPALSATEKIALATYQTIHEFVSSTTRALATLLSPPATIVMPSGIPKARLAIATTSPRGTYTTIVAGVSPDYVNRQLATLRSDILGTVAGMIQPVAQQGATNMNTIQYVNMIQDLSNLIVRNGDFRGGTFSGGSLTSGILVQATTGKFDSLLATSASFGTTTVAGDLTLSGILTANTKAVAPYFTATSTNATSTLAGSLNVDNGGFVYATSTRNIGIGILSPAALLAIKNSTSTQPIFAASNDVGAEVFRITNNGFVGIGTTAPGYTLAVEGSSSLGNQAIAGYFTATSSTATSTFAGHFAVGTSSPWGEGLLTVGTSTPLLYVDSNTGYLGLGTTSPATRFAVAGSGYLTGGLGIGAANTAPGSLLAIATTTALNFIASNAGAAAAPAYTFAGNLGTGLWSPSASTLAFSTGGAERMRLDNLGNVGIGTTTPWGLLSVNPNGLGAGVPEFVIGSSTATHLIVQQNGNVGIGTSSPAATLGVAGAGYFSGNLIASNLNLTSGALTATGALSITSGAASDLALTSGSSNINIASGNSILATGANSNLGSAGIKFNTLYVNTVNATTLVGTVSGGATNSSDWTINAAAVADQTMNLIFDRGGSVANALLTWNANGNAKRFEFNQPLFIQNASASTTLTTLDLKAVAGQTADIFRIASSSGANLLNFSATGNLGIGVPLPAYALDVAGSGHFTGLVDAANLVATSSSIASIFNGGFLSNASSTITSGLFSMSGGASTTNITASGTGYFASLGGTAVSALTANYVPKWNSGTFANSLVYDTGTNVGVGTSTPQWNLQVAGTRPSITLSDMSAAANLKHWLVSSMGGNLYIGTSTDAYGTSTPAALTISNAGNATFAGTITATSFSFSSPLAVGYGGTGAITLTGLLQGNGTSAVTGITGTAGQFPYYNGTDTLLATSTIFLATSGNIGIGTSSPQSRLAVSGGLSVGADYNVAAPANGAIIEGNVGIGTTTPGARLDVDMPSAGAGNTAALLRLGTTDGNYFSFGRVNDTGALSIQGNQTGNNNITLAPTSGNVGIGTTGPDARLNIVGTRGTTYQSGILSVNDDTALATGVGGSMILGGKYTAAGAYAGGGAVWVAKDNATDGQYGFSLNLGTRTNSVTSIGADVTIDSTGNVGIGTTGPGQKLDVANAGDGSNLAAVKIRPTGASTYGAILYLDATSNTGGHNYSLESTGITDAIGAGKLTMYDATAGQHRMVIDSSGNVGIGTTGPGSLLEVSSAVAAGSDNYLLKLRNNTTGVTDLRAGMLFQVNSLSAKYGPTIVGRNDGVTGAGDLIFGHFANDVASESMRILYNGNVGIGTTSPQALLNTYGNLASDLTGVRAENSSQSGRSQVTVTSGTYPNNIIGVMTHGTSYAGTNYFGVSNSGQALIIAQGTDQTLFGIGTYNAVPFTLATNNVRRMTIDTTGNVGIGTSTPADALSVVGSVKANNSPSIGGFILANQNGINRWIIRGNNAETGANTGSDFTLEARSDTGASLLTPFTVVRSTGNVGIGTTGPGAKFEVAGTGGSLFLDNGQFSKNRNPLTGVVVDATKGSALVNLENSASGSNIQFFTNAAAGGTVTEKMRIIENGNVGIGTTSPDVLLSVGSATPVGNVAHFENSTGSCYINPTTTALVCSSDLRLKTNLNAISTTTALAGVEALSPTFYNWKTETAGTPEHAGFIAQQVQPIFPDLVAQEPDGYYTMNYAGLTPYLTAAVQALAANVRQIEPLAGVLSVGPDVNAQCVVGDTRLRRRRRKKDLEDAGWEFDEEPGNGVEQKETATLADGDSLPTSHLGGRTKPVTWKSIANWFSTSSALQSPVDNQIKPAEGIEPSGHKVTGLVPHQAAGLRRVYHAGHAYLADDVYVYDEVEIKDIVAGNEIQSLDERTGRVVYSRVNALMDMGEQEVYELVTKSGRRIRTTSNHPFLARAGTTKS